jgi:SAM-dependent methyltransferase
MLDPAIINQIRGKLHDHGSHSWTSATFQNQLLSFIQLNAHRGDFVIEVGCARGGLTAQLAYLTSDLGKQLYVVDVDQGMLDLTAEAVNVAIGSIPDSTHFVRGDLRSFLARPRVSDRCIIAFIDGDHRYTGVIKDIRALVDSPLVRPYTIAFHDYALRYNCNSLADVLVDEAIRDTLGNETLMPMGELSGLTSLGSEPSEASHQAYYYKGGIEGVFVTLPPGLQQIPWSAIRGPIGLRTVVRRLAGRYLFKD